MNLLRRIFRRKGRHAKAIKGDQVIYYFEPKGKEFISWQWYYWGYDIEYLD